MHYHTAFYIFLFHILCRFLCTTTLLYWGNW